MKIDCSGTMQALQVGLEGRVFFKLFYSHHRLGADFLALRSTGDLGKLHI